MRTLHSSMYIEMLKIEGAATAGTYPASGSYPDVGGYGNFGFLIGFGANTATTTAPTFQVKQATNASGTLKIITGGVSSFTAAADDKWTLLEFETARLDIANGYDHVAITNSAGGLGAYLADGRVVFFLAWNARHMPITQSSSFDFGCNIAG